MNTVHYQAIVAAPGFALGVQCNADEITAIDFLEPRPEQAPETPLAAEAVRQLHAYLADPSFEFGLPLRPAGTTSSAASGPDFGHSAAARPTPTVNWQKTSKMRRVPSARLAAPTLIRWLFPVTASSPPAAGWVASTGRAAVFCSTSNAGC
jgi:hypothetical protein